MNNGILGIIIALLWLDIPYKVPASGYVLPKGIVTYLRSQGCRTAIYQEDLNSLKTRLVQGNKPLIVLVGNGMFWQHYMTRVGYDGEKRELYFFDSGREGDENAALPGNRTMTEEYFQEWWSNGLPVFNHIAITAERSDKEAAFFRLPSGGGHQAPANCGRSGGKWC